MRWRWTAPLTRASGVSIQCPFRKLTPCKELKACSPVISWEFRQPHGKEKEVHKLDSMIWALFLVRRRTSVAAATLNTSPKVMHSRLGPVLGLKQPSTATLNTSPKVMHSRLGPGLGLKQPSTATPNTSPKVMHSRLDLRLWILSLDLGL